MLNLQEHGKSDDRKENLDPWMACLIQRPSGKKYR
jgi:hypothetical protein